MKRIGNSNPFEIKTPETLRPEEIIALFENVFADVPKINQIGHTFIHGARGSGKSMMFQYMLPIVQIEVNRQNLDEKFGVEDLNYFSIYIPIKSQNPNLAKISGLDSGYRRILYSHYLNMKITLALAESLKQIVEKYKIIDVEYKLKDFFETFYELSEDYGILIKKNPDPLVTIIKTVAAEIRKLEVYLGKMASGNNVIYDHGISSLIDFFVPLIKQLKSFTKAHFFLLIDDADELDIEMQEIVNTWVSHRTTDILSIKVSTQLRYSTYRTSSGSIIEFPHDFTPVDLTQIYTSKIDNYLERVQRIVDRRLKYYGFDANAEEFFPVDIKQEEEIRHQIEEVKRSHDIGERAISSRRHDDVYRYALPDYMTSLQEKKKSNTFSYSGFKMLTNISSGTIRYFLEPASEMYSSMAKRTDKMDVAIEYIPSNVQNEIIRDWSEKRFTASLPDLEKSIKEKAEDIIKLKNLIKGLGTLFALKLLDRSATERRVFSIFVGGLPKDLEQIISLGVSHGYFQRSSIRSKEKTGRKDEIIFSRTLAPYFYLDPTGYSGRLSITEADLRLACEEPIKFAKSRAKIIRKESVEGLFDSIDSEIE